MAEMDIFLMPSVHESETFGIAAVEAQAMGIPVIASRRNSVGYPRLWWKPNRPAGSAP